MSLKLLRLCSPGAARKPPAAIGKDATGEVLSLKSEAPLARAKG